MIILGALLVILPTVTMVTEDSLQQAGIKNNSLIEYSVNKSSWLSLSGTTNVNSFECMSNSGISDNYLMVETNHNTEKINFTNACLLIDIVSFDCKNQLISRDMHKALGGAPNSNIEVRLLDAFPGSEKMESSKGTITANVLITINGKSQTKGLNICWFRGERFEYHFTGTTELSMSEFEIEPPSPAFGLVRVNDKITINFNYIVQPDIISRLE